MHNRFCSPASRVAGSAAMLNTRRAETQNRSAASLAQVVTDQRDVACRRMVLRLAAFRPHLYMRDRGVKLDGHVGQIASL